MHVNFLKAERSLHRWALGDLQRIHAAEELASEEGGGVEMHVLEDAGHWVCCFHVLFSGDTHGLLCWLEQLMSVFNILGKRRNRNSCYKFHDWGHYIFHCKSLNS